MISSTLPIIESAINHLIENDPLTQQKFNTLQDKVFVVHITDFNLKLFMQIQFDSVCLYSSWPSQPHTTISGTLIGLISTAANQASTDALFTHSVTIQGDLRAGEHIRNILSQLDIDWEHLLAQRIGNSASRHTVKAFGHAKQFIQSAHSSLHHQLHDYLHKESHLCVTPQETQEFKQAVRTLRQDMERLEVKLQQFKQQRV
jgi:ubiquinone biosynthesis protein UbiJ